MYVHFQKRAIDVENFDTNNYVIVPAVAIDNLYSKSIVRKSSYIGGNVYTEKVEGIKVRIGVDYRANKTDLDEMAEKVVYTDLIDAYFNYCLGYLEYRSVRFENEILDIPNFQGNTAINYTDKEIPWTRIIEYKWFYSIMMNLE